MQAANDDCLDRRRKGIETNTKDIDGYSVETPVVLLFIGTTHREVLQRFHRAILTLRSQELLQVGIYCA